MHVLILFICAFEYTVDVCEQSLERGHQVWSVLVITAPSYTHGRCG